MVAKVKVMVEKVKENNYLEEVNDYYDMKNRIGDLLIDNQFDLNEENKTKTERLKETINKVFSELDKYREKHSKK